MRSCESDVKTVCSNSTLRRPPNEYKTKEVELKVVLYSDGLVNFTSLIKISIGYLSQVW